MPAIINSDNGVVSGSSGLKTSGANDGILALQNNGTTNVTVTAAGDVGIGTSSPAVKLEVYDASSAVARVTAGTEIFEIRNTGSEARLAVVSADPMTFRTSNVEAMRIDSSGNVGIGTTSPTTKAQVSTATGGSTSGLSVVASGNMLNIFGSSSTNAGVILDATNGTVGSATAVPTIFRYGGTESMRIDSSGNVGIGTSSPITKLDVNGTSLFRNTQYTYQPAPTALAANTTLSAAQILTQIITTSSGAITLTMPTGSTLDSGLPASFPNDGAFDFTIIDTDAGQTALNGNTGVTIVGSGAVGANSSGTFRLRKTGTATYIVYRLA